MEFLEIVKFVAVTVTPFLVLALGLFANDRRRASEIRFDQLTILMRDMRTDMTEGRKQSTEEMRELRADTSEGRKECSDDIKAVMAQLAEYPRRPEVNGVIAELRQELRDWRGRN